MDLGAPILDVQLTMTTSNMGDTEDGVEESEMIIQDGEVVGAPMATWKIVALAVGIPVGLCLIGLAVYCWRRQQ